MIEIIDVIIEKVDVVGIYIILFFFFIFNIKYKCYNLFEREVKFNVLLIN